MTIYVVLVDVTFKDIDMGSEIFTDYFTSYEKAEEMVIKDGYKLNNHNEYVKSSGKYYYEAEIVALEKGGE